MVVHPHMEDATGPGEQVLFSIVSCVLYIYSTSLPQDSEPAFILWLDVGFALVFASDYLLRFST